jgi:hypothetical protein
MANELMTFRNGVLSIYQSAIEDLAHQVAGRDLTPGDRPGTDNHIIAAGAAAAAARMDPTAAAPVQAMAGTFQRCAELGLQYLEAQARGDRATAAQVKAQIAFSECDSKWIGTLDEYAKHFGPGGGLQAIPYIRAGTVGNTVIDLQPSARVALIGDWGTGTDVAVDLLQSVKRQKPDAVIHIGDVYYSGTVAECDAFFLQIVDVVLERANT